MMTQKITYLILFILLTPLTVVANQAPVPVFITQVEMVEFVDEVEALGTLQANENVSLTSTVTELITKIHFDDGQQVTAGDILVEMDTAEEQALKIEEQSRLAEAQRQIDRLAPLVKRGAASKSTLDEQALKKQTAEARLRAIDSQIKQRQIVAPFDGVLGPRNISLGALSQPGTLITTLDDISRMKLDFSVPEVFLSVLTKGVAITATTSAWPNQSFTGNLSSINSRIDPVTRAISVRALLSNDQQQLKPGMLMRVKINKNPRQAIVIPEESLLTRGNANFVYVITDGETGKTVQDRQVLLGNRRLGEVEITEGLAVGDQIVTHGTLRVRPGVPVIIKASQAGDETLTELLEQAANAPES